MTFSERCELSEAACNWCNQQGVQAVPLNVITALDALGRLQTKAYKIRVSIDDIGYEFTAPSMAEVIDMARAKGMSFGTADSPIVIGDER